MPGDRHSSPSTFTHIHAKTELGFSCTRVIVIHASSKLPDATAESFLQLASKEEEETNRVMPVHQTFQYYSSMKQGNILRAHPIKTRVEDPDKGDV